MEHYYSEDQNSEIRTKKISQKIRNNAYEFYSSSGIFSKNRIDKGTLLLAENMIIKNNDEVLDIGCGVGILGIVASKISSHVEMSDINKRAIQLAKKNLDLNNARATIHQGNLYEKITKKDFDTILSNPPQNAGKKICFQIIDQARNHLKEGGNLQLVARPNKGGKELAKKMNEVFGNVKIIAKRSGFAVYLSEKL